MTIYTKNGSFPAEIPAVIYLSSGLARTDPLSFTPEEIAEAGYVAAPEQPAYDPATHQLDWDGSDWVIAALPPQPLLPLSARRLTMALREIDITEAMVEAEISGAISDILARDLALIEWRRAGEFDRDHPLINQMLTALDLPPEQVDTLWLWAETL